MGTRPQARLGIVTATIDRKRANPCLQSWLQHASEEVPMTVVVNDSGYQGTVRAFQRGVEKHFQQYGPEVIACFHDDLVILEDDWDEKVVRFLRKNPSVGLIGFSGWTTVGSASLYKAPYDARQLQPSGRVTSLLGDKGRKLNAPGRVACLDGCAQIGHRAFWQGFTEAEWRTRETRRKVFTRPWAVLAERRFHHHFVDRALGCLARRWGWDVYVVPVRARHLGGQTTGHASYQQWAATQIDGGDRGFREAAHRIGYETFRDVLPLRR
jgi:hypothetical protein